MPVTMTADQRRALEELDYRLRIVLPEEYHDAYESMEPKPMGAAGLKYAADGTVAWDEIWGSFCDLAMAGGPPHKGRLLEPGRPADITAQSARHRQVLDEICRGITMVTDMPAREAPASGWVRVTAFSEVMAGWLVRAIGTENVAVRAERLAVDLPVAPAFRLEKEIKNVITVIAKTSHYWMGHMPRSQRLAIATLFGELDRTSPLVQPAYAPDGVRPPSDEAHYAGMADRIRRHAGLSTSPHQYAGWLGITCADVPTAVWMMRALVVSNVVARREDAVLFVPVNAAADPGGARVCEAVVRTHDVARVRAHGQPVRPA